MDEKEQARIFEEQVDAELGISSGSPAAPATHRPDRAPLETVSLLAHTDFSPESRQRSALRSRLLARAANSRRDSMSPQIKKSGLRPVWAALAAVLILVALLAVFRQPALAAFGRLFGYAYLPQAGFVRLNDSRMLASPVAQEHDGSRLTVTVGVQTTKQTELWIEFSGSVESLDGAWLELDSGQRLDALEWNWLYEDNQPVGGRILFPTIPAEISNTTLALPQGWRLPLHWVPANQAGQTPDGELAVYPTAVPTGGSLQPAVETAQPELPICTSNAAAAVCLQAASLDEDGTHILLEAELLQGDLVFETDIVDPSPLGDPTATQLSDDQSRTYDLQPLAPPLDAFYQSRQRQVLTFPHLGADAASLHLRVAALAAVSRQASEILIDLGADPLIGQVITGPWKVQAAGQELVFAQAQITASESGALLLTLNSEPQDPALGQMVTMLDVNRPQGIEGTYGGGFDPFTRQVSLTFELVDPVSGSKKTGPLLIPITGARISLLGPFEFTFPAPSTQPAAEQTPVIVSSETYQPGAAPTPLALDDFSLSSRPLQTGDLLISAWDGANTLLHLAPAGSGQIEPFAVLPGSVIDFHLAPNRSRLDYLTATPDENGIYKDVRLFSLPLDGSSLPNPVGGPWAYFQSPAWSFDSRFLYYESFVNRMGEGRQAWILDLACISDPAACQPVPVDFPAGVSVFAPLWSPTRYQLAFGGAFEGGLADIYTLLLDDNFQPRELFNLSASPASDDQTKVWLPDGSGLLAHCAQTPDAPNQANLCRADLQTLQETVVVPLPEGFFDFTLAPDANRIAGAHLAGRGDERLELRTFNISEQTIQVLARAAQFFSYQWSPDGQNLALIQRTGDILSAAVVDVNTGQQTQLIERLLSVEDARFETRLYKIEWVK